MSLKFLYNSLIVTLFDYGDIVAGRGGLVSEFKCLNGEINFNFSVKTSSSHHTYNTRNKDNFHYPKVRPNWYKQRFVFHAIREYNDLEPSIRRVKCSHIFKTS